MCRLYDRCVIAPEREGSVAEFTLPNSSIKGHLLTAPESQLWALLGYREQVGDEGYPLGVHSPLASSLILRLSGYRNLKDSLSDCRQEWEH